MMSKLKVTRDQLSKFIEDNNTVTQFERIFNLIASLEESAGGLAPIPVIARTDISTDYEYTTTAQYMSYLVIDGLSSDITITVTDGGFDERSRFKVLNNDPTYKIIMTDGTLTFWVAPGQVVDFYLKGTTLMWASAGWETVWDEPTNTSASVTLPTALVTGIYQIKIYSSAFTDNRVAIFDVDLLNGSTKAQGVWASGYQNVYTYSTKVISTTLAGYNPKRVSFWHDQA